MPVDFHGFLSRVCYEVSASLIEYDVLHWRLALRDSDP